MPSVILAAQRALVVAGAVLAATAAPAQTAARPDSAEAAAAMARAQRMASNPMRVILEAGRIRRVEPPPSDAALAGQAQGRGVAAAGQGAAAPAAASGQTPLLTTISTLPGASPSAAVAALEPTGEVAAGVLGRLPQTAAPQATLAASVATPQLVSSVAPVFTGRLIDDAARISEVTADLSLRADGSVAEVVVLGGLPRALQRPIAVALEQWRFEPLPGPRTHRVQLVFGGEK